MRDSELVNEETQTRRAQRTDVHRRIAMLCTERLEREAAQRAENLWPLGSASGACTGEEMQQLAKQRCSETELFLSLHLSQHSNTRT